jgi:hypothetical protein
MEDVALYVDGHPPITFAGVLAGECSPDDRAVWTNANEVRPLLEAAEWVSWTRFDVKKDYRVVRAWEKRDEDGWVTIWTSAPDIARLIRGTQVLRLDPIPHPSVRLTILPFSGGSERERSDRRARPTATAG